MGGGFWRGLWDFFVPPDPPLSDFMIIDDFDQRSKAEEAMKALRYWRLKVSGTLVLGAGLAIWAFTPWGFVKADEFGRRLDQAVTESVQRAVKDIKEDQARINAKLAEINSRGERQEAVLEEILRSQIAATVCRIIVRRNVETDSAERGRLREDADKEQEKYKSLVGDYYPESRCGS